MNIPNIWKKCSKPPTRENIAEQMRSQHSHQCEVEGRLCCKMLQVNEADANSFEGVPLCKTDKESG